MGQPTAASAVAAMVTRVVPQLGDSCTLVVIVVREVEFGAPIWRVVRVASLEFVRDLQSFLRWISVKGTLTGNIPFSSQRSNAEEFP